MDTLPDDVKGNEPQAEEIEVAIGLSPRMVMDVFALRYFA